jgi:hypothetical protein
MNYQLIQLNDAQQFALVSHCQEFKQSLISHAGGIKQKDIETFASLNNQYFDGADYLCPQPSIQNDTKGATKRADPIFFPLTSQLYKIYCSVMLPAIISTDDEWFRVRSKTAEYVTNPLTGVNEDDYTEALRYLFRSKNITEKIKDFISTFAWSSSPCCYVYLEETPVWEYQYVYEDTATGQVVEDLDENTVQAGLQMGAIRQAGMAPKLKGNKKQICVKTLKPLQLYIEPDVYDEDNCGWGHFGYKKRRELLDDPYCLNKDEIKRYGAEGTGTNSQDNGGVQAQAEQIKGQQSSFTSKDGQFKFDMYYFPYVLADDLELRNVTVCVAEGRILTHVIPNLLPNGMNPLVFGTISPGVDKPYNSPPLADAQPYQRLLNIQRNYQKDVMARIGNIYAVREQADISQLFGATCGIVLTENPREDIVPLTGDYSEVAAMANQIGVDKMEAQASAGIHQPFQGSSAIDEKKTATEINITARQQMGIMDEWADRTGTQVLRVLDRVKHYLAEISESVINVPVQNAQTAEIEYKQVDLSGLKGDNYTIELISISPAQSKNAQAQFLTQVAAQLGGAPEVIPVVAPLVQKIGELNGIKDIKTLLQQMQEASGYLQQFEQFREQQAMAEAIASGMPPDGMDPGMQPGMGAAQPGMSSG